MAGNTKQIIQSLAVNVCIALAKGVAALFTGSGAMLAETLHSTADCSNQLLLLLGVRQSAKPPDQSHPLGYGRDLYFWSFVVALLLFSGGGVFSIYEGIHKLIHPEAVDHVPMALGILVFSMLLEGWATWGNLKEMKKRRGALPLLEYLRRTKDSDLIILFGENSAAVLGLTIAIASLVAAWVTGNGVFDSIGSILIGVVLIAVAVFLAREVKSLLIGEAADEHIAEAVKATVPGHPNIEEVLRLITVQQGPGEVLVAMKVRVKSGLTTHEVVESINRFEQAVHDRAPEIRWCFVEPDHEA
ncbi:MAG: cation diffusion facilitator family transporter [Archangium sp.]|nr:cation diffusion facilitator family transporter [Archangium sp.]